ncbi:hypothetical protein [Geminisphaera colitermitum]|uniref:hypothetical protein n=1 Tax=Geminisphaera colitermitum TaxID=1148786 RepID=UPI00019650CF|nr:hypothetical protein [Geminisphaera colitermitum]
MITHQRVELPEVRRRLAEIDAHMEHMRGRERLNRLHGRRNWWRFDNPRIAPVRDELALHDLHE